MGGTQGISFVFCFMNEIDQKYCHAVPEGLFLVPNRYIHFQGMDI